MIGTIFGRKKISEDKLANVFVNAVLRLTEYGYPTVVAELEEAAEFVTRPQFGPGDDELFAMILFAGNLMEAPKHLPAGLDHRLAQHAYSKFAPLMDTSAAEMETETIALQRFMAQINHPSKNTVYAMSKAIFHKYDLFRNQDAYFRELKAPNPIVLGRVNKLMQFCLWDWAELLEDRKVTS
ncbi:MAG TPA: hypothetical protein PLV70_06290 [Flavobacteriales bacterium]|nr:hypothetical protein [Flavobacteriales bacterium]HRN35797.1 hypothetical protein [Flavobacteriales bacterium]HRO39490.1 hypothetical protein [Flavobacteriales bacterium]HRP81286.1 hypothetical protein [Flavobacteriales bacterium]HRQ84705.1 hypothetical protein [Flavobacteriales bacterium]